jgi:hypothetical protein
LLVHLPKLVAEEYLHQHCDFLISVEALQLVKEELLLHLSMLNQEVDEVIHELVMIVVIQTKKKKKKKTMMMKMKKTRKRKKRTREKRKKRTRKR